VEGRGGRALSPRAAVEMQAAVGFWIYAPPPIDLLNAETQAVPRIRVRRVHVVRRRKRGAGRPKVPCVQQ